jgi:hypothetical protein
MTITITAKEFFEIVKRAIRATGGEIVETWEALDSWEREGWSAIATATKLRVAPQNEEEEEILEPDTNDDTEEDDTDDDEGEDSEDDRTDIQISLIPVEEEVPIPQEETCE